MRLTERLGHCSSCETVRPNLFIYLFICSVQEHLLLLQRSHRLVELIFDGQARPDREKIGGRVATTVGVVWLPELRPGALLLQAADKRLFQLSCCHHACPKKRRRTIHRVVRYTGVRFRFNCTQYLAQFCSGFGAMFLNGCKLSAPVQLLNGKCPIRRAH